VLFCCVVIRPYSGQGTSEKKIRFMLWFDLACEPTTQNKLNVRSFDAAYSAGLECLEELIHQ